MDEIWVRSIWMLLASWSSLCNKHVAQRFGILIVTWRGFHVQGDGSSLGLVS
jgi:hypothetical protein